MIRMKKVNKNDSKKQNKKTRGAGQTKTHEKTKKKRGGGGGSYQEPTKK